MYSDLVWHERIGNFLLDDPIILQLAFDSSSGDIKSLRRQGRWV
jgi:hypothetical protein